jgi:hypothetical protein
MRTIKNLLLVGGTTLLLLNSCKESTGTTRLSHYETQCANAWDNGNNQTEHINNIQAYLAANGVNATSILLSVDNDSSMNCLACTCLSGVRVDITVPNEDVAEANSLGFN